MRPLALGAVVKRSVSRRSQATSVALHAHSVDRAKRVLLAMYEACENEMHCIAATSDRRLRQQPSSLSLCIVQGACVSQTDTYAHTRSSPLPFLQCACVALAGQPSINRSVAAAVKLTWRQSNFVARASLPQSRAEGCWRGCCWMRGGA